jgi:integrase
MGRRFGKIQELPSGNHRASFIGPDGTRVFAPMTFPTEADADTWLATQRTDLVRGTWKAHEVGAVTLTDYAGAWLASRGDLKPRTRALYLSLLEHHILPTLGPHRLRDLTPTAVRDWHAKLGSSTGPTARAQAYRLLRTLCNQAVRDGELEANPCQIRRAGTVVTPERPAPTLAQIHALADKVPARYQAMVLVAAYGGLRFGELTALTRADVTIPTEGLPTVTVRRAMHRIDGTWITGTPKSDAGRRTAALPNFLAPILTAHLDSYVGPMDSDLVFATRSGQPLARSNWTATFGRARKDLHLDNVHFHDLRHAAATLAVQTGATLKDTMARLGHASPRAALLYQHAASDRDHAIARALDQAARTAKTTEAARTANKGAETTQPADPEPADTTAAEPPLADGTAAAPTTRPTA